jgi:hypothetical protein
MGKLFLDYSCTDLLFLFLNERDIDPHASQMQCCSLKFVVEVCTKFHAITIVKIYSFRD